MTHTPESFHPHEGTATQGVSLRNYIAVQAMNGLLSNANMVNHSGGPGLAREVAARAYEFADAMLERERTPRG